ncbi:MAG: SRPBCC domain-containing protein [Planctomycetota bacterium]
MKPGVVRVERTYPHPPEHVWRALTEPELLARWLMPNDFEPRVGHRFTFRTDPGPGFDGIVRCEVLELVEPERLVLSWRGGPLDTRVQFELRPEGASTRLIMEHTGFRGLRARLVQRILAIGCRTLYGRRLPALLDEVRGGEETERSEADPCMEHEQGVLTGILRLHPPYRRRPR